MEDPVVSKNVGKGYGWQLDLSEWQTPKVDDKGYVIERLLTPEKFEIKKATRFEENKVVQDFRELRDLHLKNGTLFEDPEFPCDVSLARTGARFQWMRPHEFCKDPRFFSEYISRFDVEQGLMGNCWFVAAVANLTLYKKLFFQVVPKDQSFSEKYAGIFHFRFWRYGSWVDVVVDDRLPVFFGELVFTSSSKKNVFWSALFEKAYAKVNGSYEALRSGFASEAMADFTGGVTERFEVKGNPNLFKIILKAYKRCSMMGCAMESDIVEEETPEGLVGCHVYSITKAKYMDTAIGTIPLLRLRNPWGRGEWKGRWSDNSEKWRFVSKHEKEKLRLSFDNDGEFWMSFEDFQKHFDNMEMCHLLPDYLEDVQVREGRKRWEVAYFEGEWVPGTCAGGCRNYADTFPSNPQYRIKLRRADEDDDDGYCTLIVSLLQKTKRYEKKDQGHYAVIGFQIYHLPNPDKVPEPLDSKFFRYNAAVGSVPTFTNFREVSYHYKLLPGTYCIVPSTFNPNEEGEFVLRIFSENKI